MSTILSHTLIGAGPEKVIVMGGWLGDHTVFQPTFDYLDQTKFSYCFADPRGYGGSRELSGQHTNAEVAGDVVALADALGWARFHFVGHSMMGKVAQYLCAHYGDRLKSAVGITPVPAIAIPFDEGGFALFSNAWEKPENRGMICMITTGNRLTKTWEQRMIAESLRTTTPEAYRDYFYMWQAENFADKMSGCAVPFLAITGEHDLGVPTDAVKGTIMQWMTNAELHVIANAGHYPMQETPIHLVTTIEAFMSKQA